MKMNIAKICIPFLAASVLVGCKDWVSPEAEIHDASLTEVVKDDAYYEALRAFKKSEHSVSFGWFSEWGEGNASTANMLQAVPDSMDIISLWSGFDHNPKKKADLEFVTKVKGTRVVMCSFIAEVGCMFSPEGIAGDVDKQKEYWGWKDGDEEAIHASIIKWAKAVGDSLKANGLHGIDIDYEPAEYGGSLCRNHQYFTWFVEEMGKYIGPQSGDENTLFIVDGYINSLPNLNKIYKYFDYYVSQAYTWGASYSDSMLDGRVNQYYPLFKEFMTEEEFTNKFIVTENLESALDCLLGGYTWKDDDYTPLDRSKYPSLVAFASWEPENGFRKGGFGAFRFSNESANNPKYKWMRKAIQQQNPAPGYNVVKKEDCRKK